MPTYLHGDVFVQTGRKRCPQVEAGHSVDGGQVEVFLSTPVRGYTFCFGELCQKQVAYPPVSGDKRPNGMGEASVWGENVLLTVTSPTNTHGAAAALTHSG
jgi:hypothetical protein